MTDHQHHWHILYVSDKGLVTHQCCKCRATEQYWSRKAQYLPNN